jgi:hypothetical protein
MFDLKKGQLGTEGNEYINLAFEEDRKELKRQIKETLLSNKMTIGEYRFINKNNPESYYWVQVCLSLLAARKSVFSICAVCVDITNKKKEELEKSAQTEMLKLVAQGSDELLFTYTVEDDSMVISKYMDGRTVTVFDDKDFIANLAQCQLIYSEDKKEVSDVLAELTAVKDTETVEIRVDFIGNGMYLWHRAMLVSVADTSDTSFLSSE